MVPRLRLFSVPHGGNFPRPLNVSILANVVNDDASIIDATLAGDADAFGLLVQRYQDRLFNALVRFTGSAEDASDVAQDAFIQAYTKLSTFRGGSAFYTWLYRIAFNLAMSQRRKQRPTVSMDQLKLDSGIEPSDEQASPELPAMAEERADQVQAALAQLSDQHRQIVILREIEDCSYETIAEVLNVPVGTVRSRLFRARMLLKEHLQQVYEKEVEEKSF